MRHGKKVNHLGRTSSHRQAMLSNMAASLILSKRITTTVAKAKALRKYIEPLITKAKVDETHSRREVFSYLQDKAAVTELFREISAKVGDRPGGYTRILRTGFRVGDAAEMCMMELVDFNENYSQNKGNKKVKAKATRRGRGGAKKESPAKGEEHPQDIVTKNVEVIEEIVEAEEIVAETTPVEEKEEQPQEAIAETIEVVETKEEQPEAVVAEIVEEPVEEKPVQEAEEQKEE